MQTILSQIPQLSNLNPNVAFFLLLIGLIYGIFGWRIMQYLIAVDAIVLALIMGMVIYETQSPGMSHIIYAWIFPTLLLLVGLPWLAWRYPDHAIIGMCGFVGLLSIELFLLDIPFTPIVRLVIGGLAAGLAMALCTTLCRQTAVVVTGLHGAWLCVAAMVILDAHTENYAGRLIHTLFSDNSFVLPGAAIVISVIMIAIQWAGMEQKAMTT